MACESLLFVAGVVSKFNSRMSEALHRPCRQHAGLLNADAAFSFRQENGALQCSVEAVYADALRLVKAQGEPLSAGYLERECVAMWCGGFGNAAGEVGNDVAEAAPET